MDDNRKTGWKTFTEEIEVTGQQLLETVNRLIAEGNVRKLNIKSESGDVFLSVPLTGGAVAGGILVVGAPWLALIAGVAGLLAKVKLEVVRVEPPADEDVDI
ncbi:MAG TPA: DUF4342 domain-containing protein [Devosia sp.]|nr:DUF4342 domain-containing protein [Devosia sp.]